MIKKVKEFIKEKEKEEIRKIITLTYAAYEINDKQRSKILKYGINMNKQVEIKIIIQGVKEFISDTDIILDGHYNKITSQQLTIIQNYMLQLGKATGLSYNIIKFSIY